MEPLSNAAETSIMLIPWLIATRSSVLVQLSGIHTPDFRVMK